MTNLKIIKTVFMVFIVLSSQLTSSTKAYGQNNNMILGNGDDIVLILRIEILDKETQWPVNNAEITLREKPEGYIAFNAMTQKDGIAIILVKERYGYIPGIGELKVISPNYKFFNKEIIQWNLLYPDGVKMIDNKIAIPLSLGQLSDQLILNAVRNENFIKLNYHSVYAPDYYIIGDLIEIKIELEKIPEYRR